MVPLVDRGILVDSHPAGEELRRWEIELGGHNRCRLRIVPAGVAEQQRRLALARQSLIYDLSLRGVEVSVQLKLEAYEEPLRQVTLLMDPQLRLVTALRGDAAVPWSVVSPPGSPLTRLVVTLPEPIRDGTGVLRLRALAPLAMGKPWRLPRIYPEGMFWQEGDATLLVPGPLVVERLTPVGCRQTGVGPLSAPQAGRVGAVRILRPRCHGGVGVGPAPHRLGGAKRHGDRAGQREDDQPRGGRLPHRRRHAVLAGGPGRPLVDRRFHRVVAGGCPGRLEFRQARRLAGVDGAAGQGAEPQPPRALGDRGPPALRRARRQAGDRGPAAAAVSGRDRGAAAGGRAGDGFLPGEGHGRGEAHAPVAGGPRRRGPRPLRRVARRVALSQRCRRRRAEGFAGKPQTELLGHDSGRGGGGRRNAPRGLPAALHSFAVGAGGPRPGPLLPSPPRRAAVVAGQGGRTSPVGTAVAGRRAVGRRAARRGGDVGTDPPPAAERSVRNPRQPGDEACRPGTDQPGLAAGCDPEAGQPGAALAWDRNRWK